MKKIVLTGGGTAGHVTPNLALVQSLKASGYEVFYVGSIDGMEKGLVEAHKIPYYGIATGKLRRYLSAKNLTDAFRTVKGVSDAIKVLKKLKPNVVFSKGGFVSVPVTIAAYFLKIPVVSHESDMTPGLANKISLPFTSAVCVTFPETLKNVPEKKAFLTGSPIRDLVLKGSVDEGLKVCSFDSTKPVVLVMGGSSGSAVINSCVREALPSLVKNFQIVHICGKGNVEEKLAKTGGYKQFEYVDKELGNVFSTASIVVSRAGSNSIHELLALKKPNLLIPLSAKVSRGDQILNAASFEKRGFSLVLQEEQLNASLLAKKINELYNNKQKFVDNMSKSNENNGISQVMKVIEKYSK